MFFLYNFIYIVQKTAVFYSRRPPGVLVSRFFFSHSRVWRCSPVDLRDRLPNVTRLKKKRKKKKHETINYCRGRGEKIMQNAMQQRFSEIIRHTGRVYSSSLCGISLARKQCLHRFLKVQRVLRKLQAGINKKRQIIVWLQDQIHLFPPVFTSCLRSGTHLWL